MNERYGSSIFCDDIRLEVGGKLAFAGVYGGAMYSEQFPITLPKFYVYTVYQEDSALPHQHLQFRLYLPGEKWNEVAQSEDVTVEGRAETFPLEYDLSPEEMEWSKVQPIYRSFTKIFCFAPLVIERPGLVRIRVLCGDEEIKLGALAVLPPPKS
jgi:hypothetical protein